MLGVAFVIDGFCAVEVKLKGPVQLKVAPAVEELDVRFSVLPAHIGELLPAVGLAGSGSTDTSTVAVLEIQPFVSVAYT